MCGCLGFALLDSAHSRGNLITKVRYAFLRNSRRMEVRMDPATVRTQSSVRCMDTRTPSVVARRRLCVGIHQLESSDAKTWAKVTARVSTMRNDSATFGAGLRSAEEDESAFQGEEDAPSRRERMHRYASSTCHDSHGSERTDANDCDEGFLPCPMSFNSGTRDGQARPPPLRCASKAEWRFRFFSISKRITFIGRNGSRCTGRSGLCCTGRLTKETWTK